MKPLKVLDVEDPRELALLRKEFKMAKNWAALTSEGRLLKPMVPVAGEIVKRFKRHGATNAEVDEIVELLVRLTRQSVSQGQAAGYLTVAFAQSVKQNRRSANGGTKSGEKLQAKALEWTSEALPLAKKYVAENPKYSQDKLATEIKHQLDDLVPGHGQIKNVISAWQKSGAITKPERKNR
jgi:hypothetical protein